jgi:hypothetical protein
MSYGDHIAMQKIAGDDSERNAIMRVLRKYFESHVHSSEKIRSSINEDSIKDALKSYFKSDDWS